jgi:hypothetical protein
LEKSICGFRKDPPTFIEKLVGEIFFAINTPYTIHKEKQKTKVTVNVNLSEEILL